MVTCESCGKDSNKLIKVKILGSVMEVCDNCKSLGEVLDKNEAKTSSYSFKKNIHSNNQQFRVINNYSSIINKTLSVKGLNFHQLAKETNIKESTLTKYLSEKINLDVETAKKIEHFLKIKLIEEVQEINPNDFMENQSENEESLSLGDLIKKQLNKK